MPILTFFSFIAAVFLLLNLDHGTILMNVSDISRVCTYQMVVLLVSFIVLSNRATSSASLPVFRRPDMDVMSSSHPRIVYSPSMFGTAERKTLADEAAASMLIHCFFKPIVSVVTVFIFLNCFVFLFVR